MRVLVTGSRDYTNYTEVVRGIGLGIETAMKARPEDKEIVIVHGGAKGADAMAERFVAQAVDFFRTKGFAIRSEVHKANWTKYGNGAGPIRNQEMIDLGADVCVAFPLSTSNGTFHCMKAATAAGIPVQRYGLR